MRDEDLIARLGRLHETLATCHPKLARGQVWCHSCGYTRKVNTAAALRNGWPLCCGQTMSIDSPEERASLRARST
jgi:hypothetical protein